MVPRSSRSGDWLLYDQSSPSSADHLAVAAAAAEGKMSTATVLGVHREAEVYFPPAH